jgi:glycosyltransferase involved in cell wall biosynthesis
LFVSHYNYYRNFETLIRALPRLRNLLQGHSIKLLLTCSLVAGSNPGAYRSDRAAGLIRSLDVSEMVVELGTIPYHQLHQVYARAHAYVTPAYTETFAHPLVEAMASGVPVVASDLAVHREICGDAAVYFPKFSSEELAESVARIAQSPEKARLMAETGRERSRQFSWKIHVEKLLEVCYSLLDSANPNKR